MNTEVTNNDVGSVDLFDTVYAPVIIKFAGADTFVAGTILALDPADDKYIAYDPDSGTPAFTIAGAVMRDEVVVTGAGDVEQRVIVGGQVRDEKLVIDDGATLNEGDRASLRQTGIIPLSVDELGFQDNQT